MRLLARLLSGFLRRDGDPVLDALIVPPRAIYAAPDDSLRLRTEAVRARATAKRAEAARIESGHGHGIVLARTWEV